MLKNITKFYNLLLKTYSHQGWWPLLDLHNFKAKTGKNKGCNPTKTGSMKGYHPGDYSYPKIEKQRFEICIGAILTQNTSWQNVEKALIALDKNNMIDAKKILSINKNKLAELIKPAGYFNQKARKLKEFSEFYLSLKGKAPTRKQLLEVWGIGRETADSILLYAYKVPIFIVDAYTRRVFSFDKNKDYDLIRKKFEKALSKDYKLYQEYHALIVEHAKTLSKP